MSRLTVGVIADSPVYAHGLCACLRSAGYRVDSVADVRALVVEGCPFDVLVVRITSPGHLESIAAIRSVRKSPPIIGLVRSQDPADYVDALYAGATSAAWQDAELDTLLAALASACLGASLLPTHVVRLLVGDCRGSRTIAELSESEIELLRALSQGETVRALAARAAYSERAMHRRLRVLYQRLGARNRSEAISSAHLYWDAGPADQAAAASDH